LDGFGWRREVRIAGAEVDDVDAAGDELTLLLRDGRQRVVGERRKSTSELRH
jgi:hypothetical protein